ncbi:MAG: hypothetical protein DCC75_10125 [Proteobacteria bacterium]|nr:MAG: hypothetical protein DCC75_10125 [Pseudomonadota bacterium]
MLDVAVDKRLKDASQGKLHLGVVSATVTVMKNDPLLWAEIDEVIKGQTGYDLSSIAGLKQVTSLRNVYRRLGKDPGRYRGSNEALLRRVAQGKGLYKINSVVDINNLVSIESRRSVGSYDVTQIKGAVVFRVGKHGEQYQGIGKDMINLDGLPVFCDGLGPFGSPTSDSERACIRDATTRVMMIIISFDGDEGLQEQCRRAATLLEKYVDAYDFETVVV